MSKDPNFIDDLLEGVKSNQISIDEAKAQLSHYDELGFAKMIYIEQSDKAFPKSSSVKVKLKNKLNKLLKALLNTTM